MSFVKFNILSFCPQLKKFIMELNVKIFLMSLAPGCEANSLPQIPGQKG